MFQGVQPLLEDKPLADPKGKGVVEHGQKERGGIVVEPELALDSFVDKVDVLVKAQAVREEAKAALQGLQTLD